MTEEIDYTALVNDGGGETPYTGNVRVYDSNNYYVTLRLTDIHGAYLTEVDDPDTGEPVNSLVIPLRKSGLTVTPKKNVLVTCRMEVCQIASKHHTHLLTQITDRTVLDERRRLGFRQGFVGFARPMFGKRDKNKK